MTPQNSPELPTPSHGSGEIVSRPSSPAEGPRPSDTHILTSLSGSSVLKGKPGLPPELVILVQPTGCHDTQPRPEGGRVRSTKLGTNTGPRHEKPQL